MYISKKYIYLISSADLVQIKRAASVSSEDTQIPLSKISLLIEPIRRFDSLLLLHQSITRVTFYVYILDFVAKRCYMDVIKRSDSWIKVRIIEAKISV